MARSVTCTICVHHERSTHCCALRTMQSHIRMVAGFLEHMGRQVLTTGPKPSHPAGFVTAPAFRSSRAMLTLRSGPRRGLTSVNSDRSPHAV